MPQVRHLIKGKNSIFARLPHKTYIPYYMKSTTNFILLFLPILIFLQLSCDNNDPYDGGCGFPPPNEFSIQLQNSEGEDLIGSLYTQANFDLVEDVTDRVITAYSEGLLIYLHFGNFLQDTDYYIHWDENDTDTLSFKWEPLDTECFNFDKLTEVKHNDIELNLDNGVILIQ